jgi:hypothetical protein
MLPNAQPFFARPRGTATPTHACSAVRPAAAAGPHQPAQRLTAAGEPRTYGSDRDIEDRGNFFVAHSLKGDEQDYRSLLHWKFGESALKIAQFESPSLLRRTSQKRFALVQPDCCPFARGSPDVINVLVVEYR